MTRSVSISVHTGPLRVVRESREGEGEWTFESQKVLQSGESDTSIVVTDTSRLVIQEINEGEQS